MLPVLVLLGNAERNVPYRYADDANVLGARLFARAETAGVIRDDLDIKDLAMLLEQMTAIRVGDGERTRELRQRYLALIFDGLRPAAVTARLPGTPPTAAELGERWIPS